MISEIGYRDRPISSKSSVVLHERGHITPSEEGEPTMKAKHGSPQKPD
jgi:hypothetical protein